MPTVCLDNAEVILNAPPATLAPPNATIPAGNQTKLTVDGKNVLVKGDIRDWASKYTVGYTSGSFTTPGTLGGSGALIFLAAKRLKAVQDPILETTKIILILTPKPPAIDNTKAVPVPDPQPIYMATVKFLPPEQPVKLTSL